MKQVLIPTDFSPHSYNAIIYALFFFQNEKVIFHFIHIWSPVVNDKNELEESQRIELEFKKILQEIKRFGFNELHQFKIYTVKAPFIEWIRQFVKKMSVDMILLASKGNSQNNRLPVGWHTKEIITKVKCTILLIPGETKFKALLNLGFTTDFNLIFKNHIIESLQQILNVQPMNIKIIRVAPSERILSYYQNTNRMYFKERLNNVQHSFHLLENREFEYELQRLIDCLEIDMIAIIAKNLNFLKRLLFKEHDPVLSYTNKIPFLIIHE